MARNNFKIETSTTRQSEHKHLLKSLGITNVYSSQTRTQKYLNFSVEKKVDKDWLKEKLQSLNLQEV